MPHLADTVDTVIALVNLRDALDQSGITHSATADSSGFELPVTTRGDKTAGTEGVQRLAYELDGETITVVLDELDHFRRWGSSSDATKG
ncbi:hypothetical protein ACGE24_07620 [Corynebacterium kroppenstedtii]|uniref:hypothetical protein n=1 Tax=Corynebacterium sp. PCR 32 TaxID=3351342 RepID=UPI0030AF599C